MPEYLAPAVYVEETSFRAKSIEGVGTSTTGFAGPARKGPITGAPEIITSFGNFEQVYGGFADLEFATARSRNFVAHAVKGFFDNGGARLFVARTFLARGGAGGDGVARSAFVGGGATDDDNIRMVARTPGAVGNGVATTTLVTAPASVRGMQRAPEGSVLLEGTDVYLKTGDTWADSGGTELDAAGQAAAQAAGATFVTVNVLYRDGDLTESFYEDLGLGAGHPRFIGDVLSATPARRIDQLENPLAVELGDNVTAFRLHAILSDTDPLAIPLTGGNDGRMPNAGAYTAPLGALQRNEDIAILAAPGSSSYTDANGITEALLTHVEARRAYRFAVLDAPPEASVNDAIGFKSRIDSSYAAVYHPWVIVSNPLARPDDLAAPREIMLPPSGFVCGIFARNDNTAGVAKSPGNEVVRGALRFEQEIGFGEQGLLNPRGVNCLRYFPGRGNRLWGARTASSDPEWKYVGPRRMFLYLEHSIDRSTQWAVFENNGPQLWANIRETVSSFLYNEWRNNSLLGASPEEAYFVRCDRTTMTQNDLDNGRLVCLIGVSVLKPAEFVIFRIGQKTADSRD